MAIGKQWSTGATTKLIFHVLDAPAHSGTSHEMKFNSAILSAAENVLIEGCNGYEYETEEEFCHLLNTILQNPQWCQTASEQSTHIAKNYDKATFAEKIENVYEAITS